MDPNPPPTSTSTEEDQNSKTTIDQTDQPASDMGSGRSYECVFCKRGFTTAQALGGHMNIHRKDRVKTKPNTTNPSKPEPFNHHSALRPTTTTTLISTSHHQSFQTYFPTSSTWCLGSTTTTTTPPHDHQLSYVHSSNNVNDNTRISNAFKENLTSISLAPRSSALDLVDRRDKRSDGNEDDDDDDDNDEELDLELRLGHDR